MHDALSAQLGYLLIGHGTRDPQGQAEFRDVAKLLAAQLPQPVASAFLELAEPTIAHALAELHQRGVRQVFVVPLLLFSAGHAKEDVPGEVARAAREVGLDVVGQSGALELQPKLLELSRLRFWEALGGQEHELTQTRLLMVGRGGSDVAALDMMRRYTEVLSASLGVTGETAFVALAKPALAESLQNLAAGGATQIVVQPHLLFEGEVLHSINRQVAEARESFPHMKWSLSRPLGPHPLLIEAIVQGLAAVPTVFGE